MSLSLAVSAQDIIVTRDNKRIDANITEVSGDNIRYKKANSPDGPVFVMPVKDINSIVYKNGDVQTFEETAATQSQPAAVKKSEPAPKSEVANERIIYTAAEFTGDTLPAGGCQRHSCTNYRIDCRIRAYSLQSIGVQRRCVARN